MMHFTESKYEPMMSAALRYKPPGRCFMQNTGGVAAMTSEELLTKLQECHGISVDKKTPYNYAKYGWIPAPKVINKGRAGGKVIDYDECASVEFVASYRLKREKKASREEVALARKYAKDGLESMVPCSPQEWGIMFDLSLEWDRMLEAAREAEDPKRRLYKIEKKRLYNDGPQEQVRQLFNESFALNEEFDRTMQELVANSKVPGISIDEIESRAARMRLATEEYSASHDAIMAKNIAIFDETDTRARSTIYDSD